MFACMVRKIMQPFMQQFCSRSSAAAVLQQQFMQQSCSSSYAAVMQHNRHAN
jgi:hypothetical protein